MNPSNFYDLTGQAFSRLTVLSRANNSAGGRSRWICRCDCGVTKDIAAKKLRDGSTKSCGCLKKDSTRERFTKHGQSNVGGKRGNVSPTYMSWQAMKQRCLDPNAEKFPKYGALDVTICDRWLGVDGFENFLTDLGERPEGATLGRFGDVGNYEPRNVKWMDSVEQRQNWRPDRNLGCCSPKEQANNRRNSKPKDSNCCVEESICLKKKQF
jgi:hypothetical protein